MRSFWHSTHHRFLESILKHGLIPKAGSCIDGYENRISWGRSIFLWPTPRHAFGWASSRIEVVVGVYLDDDVVVQSDPAGHGDVDFISSVFITCPIPPEDIFEVIYGPYSIWQG